MNTTQAFEGLPQLLARADWMRSYDSLRLSGNATLTELLEGDSTALWSGSVTLTESSGKSSGIYLLVTGDALHALTPKPLDVLLSCPLSKLRKLVLADSGDALMLGEWWIETTRRLELVRLLDRLISDKLKVSIASIQQFPTLCSTRTTNTVQIISTPSSEALEEPSSPFISGSEFLKRKSARLSTKLRQLVSKKKIRYTQNGYDLDLTYITERIIAMGFPSDDMEVLFRNPMSQVQSMLEFCHGSNYRVYNLCSERGYDPAKFHGRVGVYPFDDHNPATLETMFKCTVDMHTWLSQDPDNVIAVHCKAGKGRTGLMISAYLLYSELCDSADDALDFFAQMRTKNSKGVTIPSQRRYVRYFDALLKQYHRVGRPFPFLVGSPALLTSISLSSLPIGYSERGYAPYFVVVDQNGRSIYDYRRYSTTQRSKKEPVVLPVSVLISGNCKFIVFQEEEFTKDTEICHFWINSTFLVDNDTPTKKVMAKKSSSADKLGVIREKKALSEKSSLTLQKNELDKLVKDTGNKRFPGYFSITLEFAGKSDLSEM